MVFFLVLKHAKRNGTECAIANRGVIVVKPKVLECARLIFMFETEFYNGFEFILVDKALNNNYF